MIARRKKHPAGKHCSQPISPSGEKRSRGPLSIGMHRLFSGHLFCSYSTPLAPLLWGNKKVCAAVARQKGRLAGNDRTDLISPSGEKRSPPNPLQGE